MNVLKGEAVATKATPYGSVGQLFSGEGIEAVWVAKQDEEIDPGWFSQGSVDLILVVQGEFQIEFEDQDFPARRLATGDFMVLPSNTRCRAYRWPRDRREAGIFVAVYPKSDRAPAGESHT